jgi:hypothetical protein
VEKAASPKSVINFLLCQPTAGRKHKAASHFSSTSRTHAIFFSSQNYSIQYILFSHRSICLQNLNSTSFEMSQIPTQNDDDKRSVPASDLVQLGQPDEVPAQQAQQQHQQPQFGLHQNQVYHIF